MQLLENIYFQLFLFSDHSTRIRSMNNEFEERYVKMKNNFEKILTEKNQVILLKVIYFNFLSLSVVQVMVSSKLLYV